MELNEFEKNRNDFMKKQAYTFRNKLIQSATKAELRFSVVAEQKHCGLKFQEPIFIKKRGVIKKFYIADFLDPDRDIIIEIDGDYHKDAEQQYKDKERTKALEKAGYEVYHISNKDVLNGKSTDFLRSIYNFPPPEEYMGPTKKSRKTKLTMD